jgi:outer membrane lipoprotein-sorting protein
LLKDELLLFNENIVMRGIMKYLLVVLLLVLSFESFAQQDPEAKSILDKFSNKSKSYSTIKAEYVVSTENKQNGEKSSKKGTLLLKGDKYKMDFNGSVVYFDGKSIWSYIKDANEVNITKPNKKSDDYILNNPSKLFTIYSKEYKYRYLGDVTMKGHDCSEVDLYPYDINKSYSIIKLLIDKQSLELVSAKIIEKSGISITIDIVKFLTNVPTVENDFVFDAKLFPGIEVIDLRK